MITYLQHSKYPGVGQWAVEVDHARWADRISWLNTNIGRPGIAWHHGAIDDKSEDRKTYIFVHSEEEAFKVWNYIGKYRI